jgi:hypothetical protein
VSHKNAKQRRRKEKKGASSKRHYETTYERRPSLAQQWSEHLKLAVPLWMLSLYERGGITRQDLYQAYIHIECVGATLDRLFRGTTREGEAADMFNRTAKAIAVLAYMPGGVNIYNQLFDMESFLAGLIGRQAALEHVTTARQSCFGEKPISRDALAEWVRLEIEKTLASGTESRSTGE